MDGADVGDKAPDFLLETTDGEAKALLDFSGEFLVLEMGSITCPLFQSQRGTMETLDRQNGVSTAVLYVREAHPGAVVPGHKSFEDKIACATRLRVEDGETRRIYVDDLDGHAHLAYGSMPNAVFIINKNGCVVYRAEWNNPSATRNALDALLAGRTDTAKAYFCPAIPTTVFRTLSKAGKGSAADFFKGFPFLTWTNIIKRNFRLLFGRSKSGSARATR